MSKKIMVVCGCGNEFTLDNAPRRRLRAERDAALAKARQLDGLTGDLERQRREAQAKVADLTAQIQRQAQQIIDERAARTPTQE
jgi:F0F1-type ATP synthase membrane subunit b/b'